MKYLVTGGAGFIGSHLVERLLEEKCKVFVVEDDKDNQMKTEKDKDGNDVIVIDDFSMGKWANLPRDPRLTVYKASILDDIGHLFKGIDVVFHLAALTRPQWSIVHPEETNEVNVNGTIKVLMHCVNHNVKNLVFVSSSSIYGDAKELPTTENCLPDPMCPYAATKLVGEYYCKLYQKLYGLKSNYVRPFNVYGTRQNPKGAYAGAVPTFIDKMSRDEPPTITGDGDQRRDYIHVDDATDLMVKLSKSDVVGEAFNIGSGENTSVNELYEMIEKGMGKKIKPIHGPQVFEPRNTLANISKAKKLLHWRPKITLEEGLKMTIEGTLRK